MSTEKNKLLAESVAGVYRDEVDVLESGTNAEARGEVADETVVALGAALDNVSDQVAFMEASLTSMGDLGNTIPKILRDIITANFASSPIAAISQQQAMAEEVGLLYYQKVITGNTRGNQVAGNTMLAYNTLDPDVQGFSSSQIEAEALGLTVAATLGYTLNLAQTPIRPGTVEISVALAGGTIVATDFGTNAGITAAGKLNGSGFASTTSINYATGVVTIDLEANPLAAAITANYQIDLDAAASLPSVSLELSSAPVRAQFYALRANLGMFADFSARKRFGKNLDRMLAGTLLGAINNEQAGAGLRRLFAASAGNTNITNIQPAAAVSLSRGEYIAAAWKTALVSAEKTVLLATGMGSVDSIVAGIDLAGWISEHPRFKAIKAPRKNTLHIFGTVDGVLILREPNIARLAAARGYVVTKGEDYLASLTTGVYLPLTVIPAAKNFNNPLQSTSGLATSAAYHAEPGLTTSLTLV